MTTRRAEALRIFLDLLSLAGRSLQEG